MKARIIQFILIGCFSINLSAFADSPLTSTEFSKAYMSEKTVILASGTGGILTAEIMEWLASEENPVAVKMAVINQLGWETKNRENSVEFFNYLVRTKRYKGLTDFEQNGKDYEFLCLAYLKAMENYSEVDEAITLAEKAIVKNKNRSYTFNIIAALIKAQKKLGSLNEWCDVYMMTNRVRENRSLTTDMNQEAIAIIFNYMDLYKDSCGK